MKRNEESKPKLLHNKNFILLFLGGLVSRIGNGIHNIALIWFVLDLTGSGTTTGIIMLLSTLPGVIVGPFSGVVADRISRKFLIVSMDIIRGLVAIWLAWTVYTGIAGFLHISIATVLIALSSTFFNPAVSATIPNIVDDRNLQQANSYEHFSMNLTQIIGAALGGFLIALTGVAGVFLINGASYLISAFSEMFISIPPLKENPETRISFFQDLKFGASYLYQHKDIFSLFSIAILLNFFCAGLFIVGFPFLFKEVLQVSSRLFGLTQSVFSAGALIGALIMGSIPEIKNHYRILIISLGVSSIITIFMGIPVTPPVLNTFNLLTIYFVLLILLFLDGINNAIINVPISVLLQRLIPDELRGRIFGLLGAFCQGLIPISIALAGYLLDRIDISILIIASGIFCLLITIVGSRIRALKLLGTNKQEFEVTEKVNKGPASATNF